MYASQSPANHPAAKIGLIQVIGATKNETRIVIGCASSMSLFAVKSLRKL